MSQWRIDPVGVVGVLEQVNQQVGGEQGVPGSGLVGAVRSEAADQAVADCWVFGAPPGLGSDYTAAVPAALWSLLNGVMEDVGKVGNRVMAGVVGVGAATRAYQEGQQDMAGEAQRAMAQAAASGDLSWFEAHGYLEVAQ